MRKRKKRATRRKSLVVEVVDGFPPFPTCFKGQHLYSDWIKGLVHRRRVVSGGGGGGGDGGAGSGADGRRRFRLRQGGGGGQEGGDEGMRHDGVRDSCTCTHERTRVPRVCTPSDAHTEPRGPAAGPPSQGDSLAVLKCSVLNHYALTNYRRNVGHTSIQIIVSRYHWSNRPQNAWRTTSSFPLKRFFIKSGDISVQVEVVFSRIHFIIAFQKRRIAENLRVILRFVSLTPVI